MSLPLSRIDDKYEVVAKIKEGGMGEIYKVRHRLLDEVRVVKVLHPELVADSELNERFAREARAAIQLRHPNIVQIFDFTLDTSGAGLIVMEYIHGTDLQQLIARPELPSIALAVEIACQSLRALGYLHRRGFVHRDISPDNLMLSIDVEGRPLVKIIDLGIAKRRGAESQLTASSVFLGKFRYSSPEHFGAQGSGGIESRSDLYTFGLVLYELLTGRYPIRGESTSQLIAGHLFQSPLDFSETDPDGRVPEPLRQAVLKTLAKEPDGRFARAEDLVARLEKLRADYPLSEEVFEESRQFTTGSPSRTAGVPEPAPAVPEAHPEADQDAETLVQQDPIAKLVTEVEELLSSGKLIEADRLLFQAQEDHGPGPELSTMRERLDELYQRGVESEVRALLSRARVHMDDDEYTRSVEILDKARAAVPPDSPLVREIDTVAAEVKNRSEERRERRAVDDAERRLLVLIRRKDFTKAREMLNEAEAKLGSAAIEPLSKLLSRTVDDWIQGLVQKAGVAFEAERFAAAAASLEKILAVDPDNSWIKNRLEQARAGERRQQEARRRREEREEKAGALLSEAEQARDRGDVLRARLLVANVLELTPGDERAAALASTLDRDGHAAEPEMSSLRTTPLSPELMKAYTEIEGLRAAGDPVAAWRRLNQAIEELGELDTLIKLRRLVAEEILESDRSGESGS